MGKRTWLLALVVMPLISIACSKLEAGVSTVTIVSPADASTAELLAAREVRRYLYLRTGELPLIVRSKRKLPPKTNLIVVGQKDHPAVKVLTAGNAELASSVGSLAPQQYLIKTISRRRRQTVLIAGGDSVGTLYAAYRFAE
ncbi:MAG: alpha-glucuronidase family glycosyl hydrolase, partial [Planctomycetota bacterium]|nr:alpha-glucuronidase family glycosyl hydrolase [Planctomycetota bacterium]